MSMKNNRMKVRTLPLGIIVSAIAALMVSTTIGRGEGIPNRIGAGVNYWRTIDNLDNHSFDSEGLSVIGTYQYWPSLLGLELDVEWFDNGFGGSSKDVFAPQALLLVGTWIYAAGGLGYYFTDGDFAQDPFFVLRAGLNLELLPSLFFDFNVNYRFEEWDALQDRDTDIDSDTVMLGAALRLAF